MKSLLCWILGCVWKEWVTTETKFVWGIADTDGFGDTHYGWVPKYKGHDIHFQHCTRCGKENKNYLGLIAAYTKENSEQHNV